MSDYHNKKVELLAPAGSLEKLEFAIHYGADALYLGGEQFGLRERAGNFSFAEMEQAVAFSHERGAKVYVATNIIPHESDLVELPNYLRRIAEIGVDAIIAADPGVIETSMHVAPKLDIHLSTQASVTNWRTVKMWEGLGVKRVVLARELSLEEIAEIKARTNVEIEVFVHGAVCNSYSGRCLLSNHMTDRDANRGGCAQSCRWYYDLYQGLSGDSTALFAESDVPYTMSSKDLLMVDRIGDLIDLGVDSLKIEGRMKSIHYVATITSAYRRAIDLYNSGKANPAELSRLRAEISKASHRPLFRGFYDGQPGVDAQIYGKEPVLRKYDFVGQVLKYDAGAGIATVQQRNNFKLGDEIAFYGPQTDFKQVIEQLADSEGNPLMVAPHSLEIVTIKVKSAVKPYDMLRKLSSLISHNEFTE